MASNPPAPVPKRPLSEWVSISGIVIFAVGSIWHAAQFSSQVQENTRRIVVLETSDKEHGDKLGMIDTRTASTEATVRGIDTNVQMLLRRTDRR